MLMNRLGHLLETNDERRTTDRWRFVKSSGGVSTKSTVQVNVGWAIAAGLAVAWVVSMTLRPDATINTTNLVPLREHTQAVICLLNDCPNAVRAVRFLFIDVAGNVAVFVPIGLALTGALGGLPDRRRLWLAVALGGALSIGIELMQLAIPSRATDVDDVLFNTIGVAMGAVFIVVAQCWLKHHGD
jgi:glycopeptide antibiotics resistance protein